MGAVDRPDSTLFAAGAASDDWRMSNGVTRRAARGGAGAQT
jgi:hypothetical protein